MNYLLKVEIFGVKDAVLSCDCSGSDCNCNNDGCCDCSTSSTVGELYEELVGFLYKSDVKESINVTFIDLIEDETEKYDTIKDLLDRGFELPFIFINDEVKLYGSMSKELVYEYVIEVIQNSN